MDGDLDLLTRESGCLTMNNMFNRAILLALLVLPTSFVSGCGNLGDSLRHGQHVNVVATAYSSGSSCNGAWAGRNALGGPLKHGTVSSAAADWSQIPLGTKFMVLETGRVYEVDDYGSAMVGKNKVDLFKTNYREVYHWGVRNVTLKILKPGDWEKSLAVLKPRSRWPHVREMVVRLQDKVGEDNSGG